MRTSPLLVFLALSPLILAAGDPPQNCPYGGGIPFDRAALYHRISASAEAVAPTPTIPGRRRSVGQPGSLPVANFIDTYIGAKLQKSGVIPTAIAGDEEFLRRVMLDLTGEIPDTTTLEAFIADPSPRKREQKIDQLLASDAFVDRWTMWFGDLMQNNSVYLFYNNRDAYNAWIRDSIRGGKPYDQMVRELIAASDDSISGKSANYVARQYAGGPVQDTSDNLATFAADKFLGIPLLCISCHSGLAHLEQVNTYLRGKSRTDFWRTAAFFSRTELGWTWYPDPLDSKERILTWLVRDNQTGRYELNTTTGNKSPRAAAAGQPDYVLPAFILNGEQPRSDESYRVAFGRIMTGHRQFARATVNDLWKEMMGLGIVEPAHAFDLAKLDTQATHPELLEALADDFISSGYSLRSTLRTIAMSNTYQLSSKYRVGQWNENWVPLYARHYPRRLMAEMVFDAVVKATGVATSIDVKGLTPVSRAMQLPEPIEPDGRTPIGRFLNTFGRGDRDEKPRTTDSSILQVLATMNDALVTTRVRRDTANSAVGRILAATSDPGTIADQIYMTTLSRKPTANERQVAIDDLRDGPLGERAEDLQYALLNTLEFLYN